MRTFALALLCASMTALATATASADANADMVAMGQAFTAVHSFHADITSSRGTMSMDMIKPDKMHMTMGDGKMQMIEIGSDMWVNSTGSWQHMHLPGNMLQRPMDMARNAGLSGNGPKDYTITDLGPAMLNGKPTHKYHMVNKNGEAVDMWVANNLPVQVQIAGSAPATITYSEYNSVPDITPPM
jgi:hypothetical protein